jgi:hypothetical protein
MSTEVQQTILWMIMAGAAVIAAVLWWWWPKWEVNRLSLKIRDAKARADVEDNFRKTIGQFFGGAVVLIGAWSAYSTLQTSRQQLSSQQDQTRWTLQGSHEQLISQQVSKGFEQLGNDKIVVRLGGIYALEGVMNTSEQYHQPVLEALCAFVRGARNHTDQGPPATDIQAILTVIGRRKAGTGVVDLNDTNLTYTDLHKADLSGANLSNATLNHTDLSGANLSNADLSRADLRDDVKLVGAVLITADLSNAKLSDAVLIAADLSNADLSNANLSGADLSNAEFGNADLSNAIVNQSQLDKACSGGGTKLPSGLAVKPCPH